MGNRKVEFKFNQPMTAIDGLQLLFIGLKLAGKINWSWWWVMSPTIAEIFLIVMLLVTLKFLTNWYIGDEEDE